MGIKTVKKQRPVNLVDFKTFDWPASAKASILHRVTGVAMFFAMAFVVWAWQESLSSQAGFNLISDLMTSFIAKFIAWGTLVVLSYHMIGGIRHMIMDLGYLEELESGNNSANFILVLWIIISLAAGAWLWM
ncbi:MAG: succinate dehydrogenase / fumarate reductase cytochrome b subunit [Phenylobacterium sp.]|jgi:succinate dehydrogenase / fumarate reductase cytochrome b subunit